MKHLPVVCATVIAIATSGVGHAQQSRTMVITTGGVTGVYFPAGGAICLSVNARRARHPIRCALTSTEGLVANLRTLAEGDIGFAVVQADWQGHAFAGTSAFEANGPMEDLRSVFAIHPEFYTVVSRVDAGIASFDDLRGLRVDVGGSESGQRATTMLLLNRMGWRTDDFAALADIDPADRAEALCAGEIDAMIYMVGHPSGAILEATSACETAIVPVTGGGPDALVASDTLYSAGVVPDALYRGTDGDVPTFSVDATLVTGADTPEDLVYATVESVFGNIDAFRELHAAFADLDPKRMVSENLAVPLHPGARRFYEEAGLLE